ncbi:hypothetical protein BH23ACT12_BH23ACT12_16600 [soil metagenome]
MKQRILVLALVLSLVLLAIPGAATAVTPAWAPVASATIRPGNATLTGDALCTSNFVFHDAAGNVYLGQAAHCSSNDETGSLDGCLNNSLPLGTPVRVAGASHRATLVYNSWIAMDERGESDVDQCVYNDFALVKLDPADHGAVNPSLRFAGGPTGTAPGAMDGSNIYGFGTTFDGTGLRPHAKSGVSLRQGAGGLTHVVRMDPPGISGDSGSGLVDAQGRAFGVLSTYSPRRGVNGAGDLSRMLEYMRGSGFADVTLAHGTEPFIAGPPPAASSQDPVGDLLRDLLGGLLAPLG